MIIDLDSKIKEEQELISIPKYTLDLVSLLPLEHDNISILTTTVTLNSYIDLEEL